MNRSAVSNADVATFRQAVDGLGENATDDLLDFQTIPEVLAYTIAVARQEGRDEAEAIELVCRAAEVSRDDLRSAQAVLRPLGYTMVADRLRQLARKSKLSHK